MQYCAKAVLGNGKKTVVNEHAVKGGLRLSDGRLEQSAVSDAVGATIAELNQTPKNGVFLGPIADENFLGLGLKTVF